MDLVRKLLRLIGSRDRKKLAVLIPLALLASGLEVVGASLVYSLLGIATGATDGLDLRWLESLRPGTLESDTLMVVLAVGLVAFFVVKVVMKVTIAYVQYRIVENMAARMSTRLLRGYLEMPYPFHLQRSSSDLIRNANQVVRAVFRDAIQPVVKLIAEFFLIVGLLAVLLSVSLTATVLAVAILGCAALILLRIVQPKLERLGSQQHELDASTLATLQQSLHGIREVKIAGIEAAFAKRYGDQQHSLARVGYLRATIKNLPDATVELALIGFILAFFAVTVALGQDTPQTLAILGLFAYVGQRLQQSTGTVINAINQLRFASAPINQIYDDLNATAATDRPAVTVTPMPFTSTIVVDDVTFRYEGAAGEALSNVSLRISKGDVIGICGPTGGGKTTLIDVVSGLQTPTSGRVLIDGVDLATNVRGWQTQLGVVPQSVFLIDGTLRENIALGVEIATIDDDAVAEAVEAARLGDFIAGLPDGLDTRVGERGIRISGGQRQRVAIARALYHRPSVLIFDEGTSALDNVTEREVMAALERLRGDHTILMVAHRLSTVRDASQVVLMIDGEIRAQGTFDELLDASEEFATLAAHSH